MLSVTQKSFMLGEHGIPHDSDNLIQLFNIMPFNKLVLGASNTYLGIII